MSVPPSDAGSNENIRHILRHLSPSPPVQEPVSEPEPPSWFGGLLTFLSLIAVALLIGGLVGLGTAIGPPCKCPIVTKK